jgi:hypothetical protein
VAALSSPYGNGDGTTIGPPIADVDPMEYDGSSECCLADVPRAIGALPVAKTTPDRSLMREPIPTAEQEDSGELGESPSVPEKG